MVQIERRPKLQGGVGLREREAVSSGRTRTFTMQPHGYYDSAAEMVEKVTGAKPTLFRSKTRCTSIAEWMEIGDVESERAIWRLESRYGDRSVHIVDPVSRRDSFITVLRMYRGYETTPQLLLVHRSESPEGIGAGAASKDVEVYLCNDLSEALEDGELNPDYDPDTELDMAVAVTPNLPANLPALASSTPKPTPSTPPRCGRGDRCVRARSIPLLGFVLVSRSTLFLGGCSRSRLMSSSFSTTYLRLVRHLFK